MWRIQIKRFWKKIIYFLGFIKNIPIWVMIILGFGFFGITIYGIIQFIIQISG